MISPEVMQELLSVRQVLPYLPEPASTDKSWSESEQQRFWLALTEHPHGPWSIIADYIGTKTTRQVMTHGQKLRQKLKRWNGRLRNNPTTCKLMDEVVVTTSEVSFTTESVVSTMSSMHSPPVSGGSESSGFEFVAPPTFAGGSEAGGGSVVEQCEAVSMAMTDVSVTVGSFIAPMSPTAAMVCTENYAFNIVAPQMWTGGQHGALEMGMVDLGAVFGEVNLSGFSVIDSSSGLSQFPIIASNATSSSFAAHPKLSSDIPQILDLMLSEASDEVQVTPFTDAPEILPQDLLDDLLDILSDGDLNELSQGMHHM